MSLEIMVVSVRTLRPCFRYHVTGFYQVFSLDGDSSEPQRAQIRMDWFGNTPWRHKGPSSLTDFYQFISINGDVSEAGKSSMWWSTGSVLGPLLFFPPFFLFYRSLCLYFLQKWNQSWQNLWSRNISYCRTSKKLERFGTTLQRQSTDCPNASAVFGAIVFDHETGKHYQFRQKKKKSSSLV